MNEQEGFLARNDIAAGLFAKFFGITKSVEEVILYLEGNAQLATKFIKQVLVSLQCTAENGAHLQACCQQHGCFCVDHVKVGGKVHLISFFKIHIQLLSFANQACCVAENVNDGPGVVGSNAVETLVGLHQHHVAGQQCGRFTKLLVHRFHAASQRRLVHDVVVNEREVVKQLNSSGHVPRVFLNAANKYKQVEYMQSFLGEEFEGVISGVAAFGFWVETIEHKCEGMVSITSLAEYDEFRLVEGDYSLVGMRSGRKFRMGDRVRIKVIAANLEKRQLDYEWVLTATLDPETEVRRETATPKKARRRKK